MSVSQPVGDTVRRLRAALGVSQSDLADRSGISAGAMSMVENNRLSATANMIATLAEVLDCTPDYLRNGAPDLLVGRPWLRAYADAPSRAVERVVADSSTAIDVAQRLDLKFVPDVLPAFSGDASDDDDIERIALEVRTYAGLGEDEVVGNMIRSAERLGCVVLPMDGELGRHLGLSTRIDGTAVIRVARPAHDPDHHVPGDRQRFTVAHELGHLVLHHERRPPDSATEAARVEKQAHRFAAAFLAPADPLMSDLERLGGRVTLNNLAGLKEIWGVAIKALVLRFQHLGIVDEDHARSLYKQISSRRWNKSEPVVVENETSVWLEKAVAKRFGSAGDAVEAASEASGLGSAYFHRWIDWSPIGEARREAPVIQMPLGLRPLASPFADEADARIVRLPVRESSRGTQAAVRQRSGVSRPNRPR